MKLIYKHWQIVIVALYKLLQTNDKVYISMLGKSVNKSYDQIKPYIIALEENKLIETKKDKLFKYIKLTEQGEIIAQRFNGIIKDTFIAFKEKQK